MLLTPDAAALRDQLQDLMLADLLGPAGGPEHAQTTAVINRLRQEVRETQIALGGGYGRSGGRGQGGYGQGGFECGYAPTLVYAPVPTSVYAPAPVYRQTPPVYVLPPAPARFRY